MENSSVRKRVTKAQWLAKALEMFSREGEPGVRIEPLARELDIAKAGFYWHFKDRQDLLDQMLDYWAKEYTDVVTENISVSAMEPKQRLLVIMQMVHDHKLAELDMHFHIWALKNQQVSRRVRGVMRKRLDYTKRVFGELGFKGDELETRAALFLAYESCESLLFRFRSKEQVSTLRECRLRLLTGEKHT